jgi:hypothetical protein
MSLWIKRILTGVTVGFSGATVVPFLSIEVYRLLLRLGADNHEILIRLSNRFQTPASSFTSTTILFGAILGIASGYMIVMQLERRFSVAWTLSKICSVFAILLFYAVLAHLSYIAFRKVEMINALPMMLVLFLIPGVWSLLLLLQGLRVYGGQELAAKKWSSREIITVVGWFILMTIVSSR